MELHIRIGHEIRFGQLHESTKKGRSGMICIPKWQKIPILHRTYICLLSLCLSCHIGLAQDFWQQTNGPYGGTIQALVASSSGYLFAGGSGVFRSTDNGGSWTGVNNGQPNTSVYSLAINSSGHVFAGTSTSSPSFIIPISL